MRHTGRLLSVSESPVGTTLAADAAAGATSITVDDAAVFDADGGSLLIGSQVVAYTGFDDETGVVTLSAALTAAADTDDDVSRWSTLYDEVETAQTAQVAVLGDRDQADTLSVEVADWVDIENGDRGRDGENCVIESDGDVWTLIAAPGRPSKARGLKHEPNDPHTLTSAEITAGTFTHTLAHSGIVADRALVAYVNGVAYPPSALTIDATNGKVTVVLGGWETTAETVWFDYWYRRGLAQTRLSVPIGYVWKYAKNLGSSTTYAQTTFDDSAWASGPSPFGWGVGAGGGIPAIATTIGASGSPLDVWCRIGVTTQGGALTFSTPTVDNNASVYLDGVLIWSPAYPSAGATQTVACAAGDHVIAIHGTGDGNTQDYSAFAITEAAS